MVLNSKLHHLPSNESDDRDVGKAKDPGLKRTDGFFLVSNPVVENLRFCVVVVVCCLLLDVWEVVRWQFSISTDHKGRSFEVLHVLHPTLNRLCALTLLPLRNIQWKHIFLTH